MSIDERIREIMEEIYEAGQYHKLAKSNEEYKRKDIIQALTQIKKEIREIVPEEKERFMKEDTIGIDGFKQGFNKCRQEILDKLGVRND